MMMNMLRDSIRSEKAHNLKKAFQKVQKNKKKKLKYLKHVQKWFKQ